MPVYTYWKQTF